MTISVYSLVISLVFYNISLLAVFYLRHRRDFLTRYTPALLGFITALSILRLVFPLDLGGYVLRSYRVLPAIESFLLTPFWGRLSPGSALLILWGVGTLFYVLRDLWGQLRYLSLEKQFPLISDERITRIAGKFGNNFRLKITPAVQIPYITGLFHPTIYVPDIALSDEQWQNVFRHETQHIRSHDEWKKLFFRVIRAVFWWNPLARISESEINTLIELQCDAHIAGSGNFDEQESYLRTMLVLMKHEVSGKVPALSSRLIGAQEEMKLRFEILLAPKDPKAGLRRRTMMALFIILFLLSYAVIVQPAYLPPEEDFTFTGFEASYNVSDDFKAADDQFFIYEDGEYKLYINGVYVGVIDEALVKNDSDFKNIPVIGGP